MTLEQFTTFRKNELLAFFQARYGRPWRRIVTRQAGMNPRTFDYWNWRAPVSLYRQIQKLETWARTVGFESPTDVRVQAALSRLERFKEAAACAIETSKRKQAAEAEEEPKRHEIERIMAEALRDLHENAARLAPTAPSWDEHK